MSIRDSRRSSRALVLAAALAFASLPARALPLENGSRLAGGAFTSFFETLRSVWLNVWGDSGMTIDPDGRNGSRMTHAIANEGMSIDPNGHPTSGGNATNPGEWTDEGTSIDPHG
jgi:hypothetical protein